jgi:hypothetical protein
MKTLDIAKTLMESAFSRAVKNQNVIRAQQKTLRRPQPDSATNRDAVSLPHDPKIFSTDRISGALRGP